HGSAPRLYPLSLHCALPIARFARGFGVIRSHPFWFVGVMARRASTMLRLERSRLISNEVPVTHSLEALENRQPIWANTPTELLADRKSTRLNSSHQIRSYAV